jgi:hypothetical protein
MRKENTLDPLRQSGPVILINLNCKLCLGLLPMSLSSHLFSSSWHLPLKDSVPHNIKTCEPQPGCAWPWHPSLQRTLLRSHGLSFVSSLSQSPFTHFAKNKPPSSLSWVLWITNEPSPRAQHRYSVYNLCWESKWSSAFLSTKIEWDLLSADKSSKTYFWAGLKKQAILELLLQLQRQEDCGFRQAGAKVSESQSQKQSESHGICLWSSYCRGRSRRIAVPSQPR